MRLAPLRPGKVARAMTLVPKQGVYIALDNNIAAAKQTAATIGRSDITVIGMSEFRDGLKAMFVSLKVMPPNYK